MRRKYREPENMRRVAVYEDEESMQPRKRRILFPVLITLFSVIFVVSAAVLVIELIVNPYVTDKNVGEIQKIYSEAGDTESVVPATSEDDTADSERMAELERRCEAVLKLQSVNSDITGWVQLDGTDINFPVLTPPAGDPQYYLSRNYKKESTKYGSIFLDGMCTVDSDNQVLHGHSMQDGRMFWQVIGFGSAKTVKSCPVFRYDTEKEAAEWKIVSVFKTNTYDNQGELFNYLRGDFDSAEDKMQFYYDVMKRSMVNTGVDLNENDKTVMLSTCSYEYEGFRTVIVARKVRDGEDATVDTSKITENENALYPDIWYPSGKAPDYWPDYFEDAVQNSMVDWYTGNLYKD